MNGNGREILIALGGNVASTVGLPSQTLVQAINSLVRDGLELRAVSRFFNTPCFPVGAGPDFVNAVVLVQSRRTPEDLLDLLIRLEAGFGRNRERRWGARTLDLDLLAMGDTVLPDAAVQAHWRGLSPDRQLAEVPDRLILPHPRLQDRAFVLGPMADIAPDWRHPLIGKTTLEMLRARPASEIAEITPL